MRRLGGGMIRLGLALWLCAAPGLASGATIKVGSKKFTESVILGDILTGLVRDAGSDAVHRREVGGTAVLWKGLLAGEIDIYTEYTGTIIQEILSGQKLKSDGEIHAALKKRGILMSRPLGFNNPYAIGMKKKAAKKYGIRKISDLRKYPAFKFGFSNEFMKRGDGWPGLRQRYRLSQKSVRGLDHDLAYRALGGDSIQVIDLYSTDAGIRYYNLLTLDDDLKYFPAYNAVILYREVLLKTAPEAVRAILRMEGRIDEITMIGMNSRAKVKKVPETRIASEFLSEAMGVQSLVSEETAWERFVRNTWDHLYLVAVSLGAAILVSLPLGILAARSAMAGQIILGVIGVVQTIPSLALLVFMIPLLGIGGPPAMVALFLYSLLPIVRNTYTGLNDIPTEIRESAEALGLPPLSRLRLVMLPIASRSILGGIKTSSVINVGTATLGALIGAGGYGQPILTGIRLDDVGLILQGAIPAAGLAVIVQLLFDLAERFLVSEGLRLKPAS